MKVSSLTAHDCALVWKPQVNDAMVDYLSTPLRLGQKQKAQRLGVCYVAWVMAGVALQHK